MTSRARENIHFNPVQLKMAGLDAKALKEAGFEVGVLKLHFDLAELKMAGLEAGELKRHSDLVQLKMAGFDAKRSGKQVSKLVN